MAFSKFVLLTFTTSDFVHNLLLWYICLGFRKSTFAIFFSDTKVFFKSSVSRSSLYRTQVSFTRFLSRFFANERDNNVGYYSVEQCLKIGKEIAKKRRRK